MPARLFVLLSTSAVALLEPYAAAAGTQERKCDGPSVAADPGFRERFPELLMRLRSELPNGKSVDACAAVELRLLDAGIVVQVSLPDGRATARDVSRPEDVLPTLQALLLVPEHGADPAIASEPALAPARARGAPPRVEATPAGERDALAPGRAAREQGFELSVVSGVRIGDGQYGYGAGVLSFIEIKRWLIGFQGRADGYRALHGSDPETALALGVLLGRRFEFGSTALDFTVGPALAMRGAGFSRTESASMQAGTSTMPPPAPHLERDVGPVPRLLLGARLGFRSRSLFRTFIGIDGELGPRSSADTAQALETAGRMPAYTIGLALGATVGTR